MKKKLALLMVMSFLFTAILSFGIFNPDTSSAYSTFKRVDFENGVVTAKYLNVRQGPSANYHIVCVLKQGQSVKIFGKLDDWYAIYEPGNGCVGAVSSQFIRVGTAQTPPKVTPTVAPTVPTRTVTPSPTRSIPPTATTYPTVTSSPTTTPPSNAGVSADEQTILNLVNKARASAGVGPLSFDMDLVKVARLKAQDMVNNNYFSHQSPTYGSPFDMMKQFGISFTSAGENIAGNSTAEGAFNAWMNSEGHRQNILNGSYKYTGIGVVPSPTYGKMLVQQFVGR